MKTKEHIAGYSLLELLVAISLLSILSLLSIPTLHQVASNSMGSLQTYHAKATARRVKQVLITALERSSRLPNFSGVRINNADRLPQEHISPAQLLKDSKAISFLEIDPVPLLEVIDRSANGKLKLRCTNTELSGLKKSRILKTRHWILFGIDGFSLVYGVAESASSLCNGFLINPQNDKAKLVNRLFPTSLASLSSPLLALPILDGYSIYLDREHTLRRKSLLTNENQPLAWGVTA
ncbi:MAG: prepilin-type N-terminal cleavage/methylation domain-containing protein, partial [Candidatus Paceibacterota bacterium]